MSHAGAGLLAEAADRLGAYGRAVARPGVDARAAEPARSRPRGPGPGGDVADGGDCLADLRAVRDQEPLCGPVASDATALRVINRIASDPRLLEALRAARAQARENAWNAGAAPERIVIDIDATLITAHSEKEGAALDQPQRSTQAREVQFLPER